VPYVSNDGVRIYYEVEGHGPPLLLHHGLTDTLDGWRRAGFAEALRESYSLILIDSRGHGQSDKPHETEAYALPLRLRDVTCVLDDLGIEKAAFWGFSMGGNIGLGLATHAQERFDAFVIGGSAPGPRGASTRLYEYIERIEAGGLESLTEGLPPRFAADIMRNDPEAILAVARAQLEYPAFDLARLRTPCLVYNGTADNASERARRAESVTPPCVRYAYLEGLDHNRTFSRRSMVLPVILPFLKEALGTFQER
jgi:pimeloyl-ACP methyl ester carboxylesterase